MVGHSATARSAVSLSGTICPRRKAPSPVISTFASASWMRSRRESEEKPPKTTEWAAPIRAHARSAIGSSGTMPR